jgi:polysaccharide export outer membrane protein
MLTSCAGASPIASSGQQAQIAFPAPKAVGGAEDDYRIGAQDKINITVFQEPDLSLQDVKVDASGNVLLPLIGSVTAAGLTTTELSEEIAKRLGSRYLIDPQVSVIVSSSVSQKVTVEGAVTSPGVYEVRGQTTLLEALAMAKGPNQVADLDQVVVFRVVDGQRMAARFDLRDIRRGKTPDPAILGNDTVVVGSSGLKAAWRDAVAAIPAFAIFRPF